MRWCAALFVALPALVLAPRSARADDSGFYFAPGAMLFAPNLAGAQFSGSGVPYQGDGARTSFLHSGREFGVHAPAMIGAELRLGLQHRYFEVGGQLFAAASLGDAGDATDPSAAALAHVSGMTGYGGGIHAVVAIPAGLVTFTIGPDFGVRGFEVPLTGFEPTVCRTKYGTTSCPESASYTQPYFQPRIAVLIQGDPKKREGFFFGPWAGVDVIPARSWATGFSFGWGANQNALR